MYCCCQCCQQKLAFFDCLNKSVVQRCLQDEDFTVVYHFLSKDAVIGPFMLLFTLQMHAVVLQTKEEPSSPDGRPPLDATKLNGKHRSRSKSPYSSSSKASPRSRSRSRQVASLVPSNILSILTCNRESALYHDMRLYTLLQQNRSYSNLGSAARVFHEVCE